MRRYSFFKKFLFSYVLLVMLPIIILAAIVIAFFYKSHFDQNVKLYTELLTQQVNTFDKKIETLKQTASNISTNQYLSKGYLSYSIANQLPAWQFISNYEVSDGFDSSIHLIYFDEELVVTSYAILRTPYFDIRYKNIDISIDQIRQKIDKYGSYFKQLKPTGKELPEDSYYLYVTPLPYDDASGYGAVAFFIPNNSIKQLLNNFSAAIGSECFMQNSNGTVVGLNSAELLSESDHHYAQTLAAEADNIKSGKIKIENQKYHIIEKSSAYTDITFYGITTPQRVNKSFLIVLIIICSIAVAILFLSSLLIYYLMKVNYKPLKLLQQKAQDLREGNPSDATLADIVNHITTKLDTLENYYISSMDEKNDRLLLSALTGDIVSADDFQKSCDKCGIELAGPFFTVATILFGALSQNDKKALLQQASEFSEVKCFPVDVFRKNSIALIITAKSDNDLPLIEAMRSLRLALKQQLGVVVTIGVGTWENSVMDIDRSYLNSLTSLEARLVKGLDTVIMFNEIKSQILTTFQYPHQLVEQFRNSLLSGNIDMINSSIDNIFAKIKNSDIAIVTTRNFCCNIAQVAVKSLPALAGRTDAGQDNLHTINRLMQAETVDVLVENLKEICAEYVRSAESKNTCCSEHLENMLAYVNKNYCDPNFSLQSMADAFKMSPSYVSRYFASRNNGVALLEYTNQLRMEKAKKLLRETELVIPEIAVQVAFLNVSSFMRKFKQMVGVPPGLYRQQCKRGDYTETNENNSENTDNSDSPDNSDNLDL